MSLHYLVKCECLKKFFYLTLIYYSQIAQIWYQSEDGIQSRQLSCLEVTARHAQVVWRLFFFVPWRIEHATPSLS